MIRGDVSAANRTDIFARFQTEADPKVLVIQPQVRCAWCDPNCSQHNRVVGTDIFSGDLPTGQRPYTPSGQKHKCTVIQLAGSAAEKRIYKMLDERINIHTAMIDLYKEILD